MSAAKEWRQNEIKDLARKVAEEVFEEKIKLLTKRVNDLEKAIWAVEDLYDRAIDGK